MPMRIRLSTCWKSCGDQGHEQIALHALSAQSTSIPETVTLARRRQGGTRDVTVPCLFWL